MSHEHIYGQVMVRRNELTFDERLKILRTLTRWRKTFAERAEECCRNCTPESRTRGLTEDRFVHLSPEKEAKLRRVLASEKDPIKLWRYAKGLENHWMALAAETEQLFPEQALEEVAALVFAAIKEKA